MSDQTLQERVFDRIDNMLLGAYDEVQLTPATTFAELNADSLDMMDLVMDLEDVFDVVIEDEDAEKLRTLGDAVELVRRLMK